MTQNDTATERPHAELGGSSAERWMICPGSYWLYKQVTGDEPLHINTIRGTKAHSVAESHLRAFLEQKILGESQVKILAEEDDEELTVWAKDYVTDVWEKVLLFSATNKAFGVEDEFVLDKDLNMWGYVDFWCIYVDDKGKRVGVILDYKTGYHAVDVAKNAQLAFYAVALRKWVRSHGKDLDYVRTCVHQVTSNPKYKEAKITSKQLDAWEKKFIKAAKTIYVDKRATFKCGEYCEFCKARGICKAYLNKVETAAQLRVSAASPDILPKVEALTDTQLCAISLNTSYVKAICDAVNAEIIARHNAGRPVAGVKVVRGAGKRKWKDIPETELMENLKALGISEPSRPKVITLTAAEKMLSKNKDALNSLCSLIERSEGSLTIVPSDDSRPEADSAIKLLG